MYTGSKVGMPRLKAWRCFTLCTGLRPPQRQVDVAFTLFCVQFIRYYLSPLTISLQLLSFLFAIFSDKIEENDNHTQNPIRLYD